jgi:hypothetical protein
MKTRITFAFLLMLLLGCSKNNNPNVVLSTELTGCPVNYTCTYNYYNNADLLNNFQPVAGHYRVFIYKAVNKSICDATSTLIFKTNMGSSSFDITASQIIANQLVTTGFSCICCDVIGNIKQSGGEIKGRQAGTGNWLINASVIQSTSDGKVLDTVKVNQYFTVSPF